MLTAGQWEEVQGWVRTERVAGFEQMCCKVTLYRSDMRSDSK